jgi:hypothetical protein
MSIGHESWLVLKATLIDVLPIAAVLVGFQFLVLRRRIPNLRKVALGFAYVIVGLAIFLQGLEQALFPLGKLMAAQLTDPAFLLGQGQTLLAAVRWQDYLWVYVFAFCIGFATTIAEPALIAVAMKAEDVSGGAIGVFGLRIAVALGVAVGIGLGSWRIVVGAPLEHFIMVGYLVVMVQTAFAPRQIIALAYDSGGVTTSTVTVPLVAALGLGLASNVPGRSPMLDGFGLIAFASLFPIISVLAYAQISEWINRRRLSREETV